MHVSEEVRRERIAAALGLPPGSDWDRIEAEARVCTTAAEEKARTISKLERAEAALNVWQEAAFKLLGDGWRGRGHDAARLSSEVAQRVHFAKSNEESARAWAKKTEEAMRVAHDALAGIVEIPF